MRWNITLGAEKRVFYGLSFDPCIMDFMFGCINLHKVHLVLGILMEGLFTFICQLTIKTAEEKEYKYGDYLVSAVDTILVLVGR